MAISPECGDSPPVLRGVFIKDPTMTTRNWGACYTGVAVSASGRGQSCSVNVEVLGEATSMPNDSWFQDRCAASLPNNQLKTPMAASVDCKLGKTLSSFSTCESISGDFTAAMVANLRLDARLACCSWPATVPLMSRVNLRFIRLLLGIAGVALSATPVLLSTPP